MPEIKALFWDLGGVLLTNAWDRAQRERAKWRALVEAAAHLCAADRCDQDDARRQLRKALADGALWPLSWEDARPKPSAGGSTAMS